MVKQISLLLRLQCSNLFGINEFRYTKDKAKKKRYIGLSFAWILLLGMMLVYICGFSYGMGILGMAEIIPVYLYTVVSLIILFLSFFKAGSVLFSMKSYEMLVSLPFTKSAIVVARFLEMYLTALSAGILALTPGIVIYGIFEKPSVSFYVISLLSAIFLPMLPLTISSVIGAVIKAISSKSRHKSIGETVLMVVIVLVVMLGSITSADQLEQMDEEALRSLAGMLSGQIGRIYPPATLFQNAIAGDIKSLIILILIPSGIFAIFTVILQKYFQSICMSLNASSAKNNYKMEQLSTNSIVIALWKKEWKRYMASSVYVTNTIIGYILAVILAVSMLVVGTKEVEAVFGVSGIVEKVIPFLLAAALTITSTTSCSISMEGKHYWLLQSLPLQPKDIYHAKVLLNLSLGAPFVLAASVISCIAVKASGLGAFWIFVIPLVYLCFSAFLGLAVNLKFPVLNWDSDVRVVKQSVSVFVTMLAGVISSVFPGVIAAMQQSINHNYMMAGITIILIGITGALYHYIVRQELP